MKKLLIFITIIGLMGFSWIAIFAEVKQLPVQKIEPRPTTQQQTIGINNFQLYKLISVENDKSQPPRSLIQRYRIIYETKDEVRETMIIQLQTNKEGKILNADIVSAPKAMVGRTIVINKDIICYHPCRKQCTKVILWRENIEIYFCFCCCKPGGC